MCLIDISRASEADIPLIMEIANVAFPRTYAEILSPEQTEYMMDWMYSRKSLLKQFADGHAYYIARLGGRGIGYVSVERQGERLFHLQKIYVLPDFQGRGVGRRLFEAAIVHVKGLCNQPCTLELNVNRNNKALDFYRKMGMKKVREGDFDIGSGFFMNDFIMSMSI